MQFILASSNAHKAAEINELLNSEEIQIIAAPQVFDVLEDGDSFEANAFKKAQAYYHQFKQPIVSDDSGLVLEKFPELLGIHSARYLPDQPDYKDKCQSLLELYQGTEDGDRGAYFVCYLCFYFRPEEVYFFEGRVQGKIAQEYVGDGGFGYDPIFVPDLNTINTKTLAELSEWKMENSHRAKACREALIFLNSRK
jgi:XTP/dITP diphosphohydrolase